MKTIVALLTALVLGAGSLGAGALVYVKDRLEPALNEYTSGQVLSTAAQSGAADEQTVDAFFQAAQPAGRRAKGPAGNGPKLIDVAADKLGMTREELLQELSDGKTTVADVAQSKGVDIAVIEDAFLAPREQKVKAAVTAGKLSQEEADALMTLARGRVERALNTPHPATPLAILANTLGMTQDEVRTKLRAGNTPRQIIEGSGKGVTVDQVIQAFIDSRADKLAQAVKDGKLTQAEADALKVLARGRLERMMDRQWTGGQGGANGGAHGGAHGGNGNNGKGNAGPGRLFGQWFGGLK